jgi:hypothetical protein
VENGQNGDQKPAEDVDEDSGDEAEEEGGAGGEGKFSLP